MGPSPQYDILLRIVFIFCTIAAAIFGENDREYLDDEIPSDWKDYVSLETMKASPPKDRSSGLLQGDIAGIDPNAVITSSEVQLNAVNDEKLLWPNAMVPTEFSRAFGNDALTRVKKALADIEAKTCIRFIPRKYEVDFIEVMPGIECSSHVGRQGGKQIVMLHPGCREQGATQHEFLHALGFYHEHARPDRDQYLWINNRNLQQGSMATMAQFEAKTPQSAATLDTPYDYDSAMHYGWNAFGLNQNYPTLLPKQKGQFIGRRDRLSETDILRVNKLYKCNAYMDKEKEKPSEISTVQYDQEEDDWHILCNGKVEREGGWDENPDVCLKLCDKIDTKLFHKLWVGDRNSGKALFNVPTTKRCMHKSMLCDGIKDTQADVSEDVANCKMFCKGGGYVAIAPTYQCVHFSNLCDGQINNRRTNGDGSDEVKANCIQYCQQPDMQDYGGRLFNLEPSGRCMLKPWLCDGITDSDPNDNSEDPENCKKYCVGAGYFPTADTFQCIHYSWLCDGTRDTTTGWDEIRQNCQEYCGKIPGMDGEVFNLDETGQCFHKRTLCNGQTAESGQAMINEEATCEKYCKGDLFFPTPDMKQCIRATDLCDGKPDARNGWDETRTNCLEYCRRMNTDKSLAINPKTRRCSAKSTNASSS